MSFRLRPLAVGLIDVSGAATPAGRSEMRIALALTAAEQGYSLIETYETGGNGLKDDVAFQALEALAVRLDADAVVFAGAVDRGRLHEIADRLRMMVISGAS